MADLSALLAGATGPSKALDRAVARQLDAPPGDYSSSVDACLNLIHRLFPGAHWHVGRAEDGVSVYASLHQGEKRAEKTDITVPLALLGALLAFSRLVKKPGPRTPAR